MLLHQLLETEVSEALRERKINALTLDSRNLNAETLWFAVQGTQKHGLDFYSSEANAVVLYEPPYENAPAEALPIEHLKEKISAIAGRFYGQPSEKLHLIGVTGTDGKSSLVYFLAQALRAGMIGTIGYGRLEALQEASHTTPDPIKVQALLADFVAQNMDTVAMEVSSHALSQHRVEALRFEVGVFTNLTHDHLDYHHNMEEYFLAKAKLFAQPLKYAVINVDSPYGKRLINENRIHRDTQILRVSSKGEEADVSASEIELLPNGLTFRLNLLGQSARVHSRLLARFNVDNLLNVASCLYAQNIEFSEIIRRLEALYGVVGRAERLALPNGASAVVDYAHTPSALENVLQGIRPHIRGKLWCIFGCGGDRDKTKRPLMGAMAIKYADAVIITDDNPRTEDPNAIIQDINQPEALVIQPRQEAIIYALNQLRPDDGVVIAGKGHEDYQIIGTTKHHYSDQEVIQTWLKHQN